MVNYADDRDEIFVHGTKRLLSANASVRQVTRSCWPSAVRSQRRFRGHALATQVSFPGHFVVRDFAMTCSNRFSDIDLTVGKLFHRRHTPGKQKFRTFLCARQRAVEFVGRADGSPDVVAIASSTLLPPHPRLRALPYWAVAVARMLSAPGEGVCPLLFYAKHGRQELLLSALHGTGWLVEYLKRLLFRSRVRRTDQRRTSFGEATRTQVQPVSLHTRLSAVPGSARA